MSHEIIEKPELEEPNDMPGATASFTADVMLSVTSSSLELQPASSISIAAPRESSFFYPSSSSDAQAGYYNFTAEQFERLTEGWEPLNFLKADPETIIRISLTGAYTLQKELLTTLANGELTKRPMGVDITVINRILEQQSVKLILRDDPGQGFGSTGISKSFFDGTLFVLDLDEASPRYTFKKLIENYSHLRELQAPNVKPVLVAFRSSDEEKIAEVTKFLTKENLPGIRVANGQHLESALNAMTVLIQESRLLKQQQEESLVESVKSFQR